VSNLTCSWKSLHAIYFKQVRVMEKYYIYKRCFHLVLGNSLECFMKIDCSL